MVYFILFDLSRGPFHKRVWRVVWKKLFCFRALLGVGFGLLFNCLLTPQCPYCTPDLGKKSQINTLSVTMSKVDRGPQKAPLLSNQLVKVDPTFQLAGNPYKTMACLKSESDLIALVVALLAFSLIAC